MGCSFGCGCDGGSGRAAWIGSIVAGLTVVASGAIVVLLDRDDSKAGVTITRAAQPADTAAAAPQRDFHRFGLREAKPKPDRALRLATYNLLNLFDDVDDPALAGRDDDKDMTKPAREREAVAAAIRAIDADVLALQEIESRAALDWFTSAHLADLGYRHVASIDAGDSRGIEQAVLSRFPITDIANWPGEDLGGTHPDEWGNGRNWEAGNPIRFRRSPLRVTIRIDPPSAADTATTRAAPYDLTLFIVHHKSGSPGAYWRAAEAARIVDKAAAFADADPAANIAILGDFNCVIAEQAFQTYIAAGFIDTLARAGGAGDASPALITHESGRAIDHILVNPNLAAEIVPGSAFVYGTPARPPGDWRTTPPPPGFASDHYPVVIDLIPIDKN